MHTLQLQYSQKEKYSTCSQPIHNQKTNDYVSQVLVVLDESHEFRHQIWFVKTCRRRRHLSLRYLASLAAVSDSSSSRSVSVVSMSRSITVASSVALCHHRKIVFLLLPSTLPSPWVGFLAGDFQLRPCYFSFNFIAVNHHYIFNLLFKVEFVAEIMISLILFCCKSYLENWR